MSEFASLGNLDRLDAELAWFNLVNFDPKLAASVRAIANRLACDFNDGQSRLDKESLLIGYVMHELISVEIDIEASSSYEPPM